MRSVTHMHIPFEVLSVVFHTNPSKWPLFRLNLEQFAKNVSFKGDPRILFLIVKSYYYSLNNKLEDT